MRVFMTSAAARLNYVQEAYNRGLFSSYINELCDKKVDDSYCVCTLDYLFTISIDSAISIDRRKDIIANVVSEEQNLDDSLLFTLVHSLPAVMTTNILRYLSQEHWNQAFTGLFQQEELAPQYL
jgi:hypothetical protein